MKKRERQLVNGQWYTKPKRGAARLLTRCDNTLTESEFINLFVQALRRLTMTWPPASSAWQDARRPCNKGRQKFEGQCAHCKKWFARKDIEMDHVEAIGSLREIIKKFASKVLPEKEGWQPLCKPCHKLKTHGKKI